MFSGVIRDCQAFNLLFIIEQSRLSYLLLRKFLFRLHCDVIVDDDTLIVQEKRAITEVVTKNDA